MKAPMIVTSIAMLIAIVAVVPLEAQSAPPANPTFDVASVKPNKSAGGPFAIGFQPGGRFIATNATLRDLIAVAYGKPQPLPNFQIFGAPDWIASERFDIEAKTDTLSSPETNRQMLQALLADRFKVLAHTETRELPIYVLVLARSDGRLGPQLRRAAVDCAARRATAATTAAPLAPPPPGQAASCGIGGGPGRIDGGDATMAQIVNTLSRRVNRVVVDRTGLDGRFDLQLTWTPDQPPNPAPPGAPPPSPIDPNGPSIYTAVEEQLGLKLQSARGPVEVLVIDTVEQPTPD